MNDTEKNPKSAHRSASQAMVQCKCPICHEGDMFKSGPLNLAKFNELKERCEVCGYNFMPEPGFYQISLYFTYAINVGIFLVAWLAVWLLFDNPALWVYLVAVTVPALVIAPWNLRYSKVIMLYTFGDVKRYKERFYGKDS